MYDFKIIEEIDMNVFFKTVLFIPLTMMFAYAPILSARIVQPSEQPTEEGNDELIEQRYKDIYNAIVTGKFSEVEVARSLAAVLKQVAGLDYATFAQKQHVIKFLVRTVGKLLRAPKPGEPQKKPDYFHGKAEANFRKGFLRELQKTLEISDDLIETKMLVWQALTGETE